MLFLRYVREATQGWEKEATDGSKQSTAVKQQQYYENYKQQDDDGIGGQYFEILLEKGERLALIDTVEFKWGQQFAFEVVEASLHGWVDSNSYYMQGTHPWQDIPLVVISPEGKFKYILIKGKAHQNGKITALNFIRGDKNLEYHADNFRQFSVDLQKKGWNIKNAKIKQGKFEAHKGLVKIEFTCPGGGRIEHNTNGHKCFIYGYSKTFGRVDHSTAQQLISQSLHYSHAEIETSKEGY